MQWHWQGRKLCAFHFHFLRWIVIKVPSGSSLPKWSQSRKWKVLFDHSHFHCRTDIKVGEVWKDPAKVGGTNSRDKSYIIVVKSQLKISSFQIKMTSLVSCKVLIHACINKAIIQRKQIQDEEHGKYIYILLHKIK